MLPQAALEPVHLGGEDEVALHETVYLVGENGDVCAPPAEVHVGVVVLLLGELAHTVHKIQRLLEVREAELPLRWCPPTTSPPGSWRGSSSSCSSSSGGTPPLQGTRVLLARSDISRSGRSASRRGPSRGGPRRRPSRDPRSYPRPPLCPPAPCSPGRSAAARPSGAGEAVRSARNPGTPGRRGGHK